METRYQCQLCGRIFSRPQLRMEARGEQFGFPAAETVAGCPRCGGAYIPLTDHQAKEVLP